MRILIDINHPAHVHYFRNFYKIMTEKGHSILVVSRNKEIEHDLLRKYNIPFVGRGQGKNGSFSKFIYMIYADFKILLLSLKFKPDLFLNFLHPYPSHVSWLLGKVSLVFSDSDHAKLHHQLTVPFATKVLTPEYYKIDLGKKHIRFQSYMEVSYLHPNYFRPDPSVLDLLGVKESDSFVIVRFVSWNAAHDFGHKGFTLENKRKAISVLSKYSTIFISSEGQLPDDLEKLRIKIPSHKMHDALYYCALLFGESATMASEAAVLGTPSIIANGLGYVDEKEAKYHLVNNFTVSESDQLRSIERGVEILQEKNKQEKYRNFSKNLLANSIDTTAYMVEEVLKYEKPDKRIL